MLSDGNRQEGRGLDQFVSGYGRFLVCCGQGNKTWVSVKWG